jgi:hypothetical protein
MPVETNAYLWTLARCPGKLIFHEKNKSGIAIDLHRIRKYSKIHIDKIKTENSGES